MFQHPNLEAGLLVSVFCCLVYKDCSLLFGCPLFPLHTMRKADSGETAPNWLGAAQLITGGTLQ